MSDQIERYSVEVGKALGLDVRRAYPRIAYALRALEGSGELVSRFEEAAGSGLGRRYFKWASKGA